MSNFHVDENQLHRYRHDDIIQATLFDVGEEILNKYYYYHNQQLPAYFLSNEENLVKY